MITKGNGAIEAPTALAPDAEKGTALEGEQIPTDAEESQPTSLDMALSAPGYEDLPGYVDPIIEESSQSFYKTVGMFPNGVPGGGMMPVQGGSISSAFGSTSNRGVSGNAHNGMDISVPIGTPVTAPMDGRVVWAKWAGAYGNAALLQMADGSYHLMGHLSGFSVKSGQSVSAGQQIGLSGNTGRSSGPHLHWEVRRDATYGSAYNPQDWLSSAPSGGGGGSANYSGGNARQVTQQAYGLMRSVGANHDEARFLASVVMPESGGRAGVVNSIGATGLWQILYPVHRSWLNGMGLNQESLKNPQNNARAALRIYRDRLPRGRAWAEAAWEVTQLDGGRHRQYLQYV